MTVASPDHSPASSLSRSYSAPAKIKTTDDNDSDKPSFVKDNFLTRTILAPILFLSFILSLAIVDRKRRLEEDRQHGVLTKRQQLLYFWLYWKIPQTPKDDLRSATEPCLGRTSALEHDSDSGRSSSRRGSSYSEDCGERGEAKMLEIKTLAEKQREARSLSAEAFSIQNRVLLGMGAFSIGFGLLCWATYLKFKQLLGFI
ncbi:uncharacterized protein DFL_008935 [Arthrobotrys flagrans]|uniref:Uncharacterized protein n=1 Tax=Arthrobotrys flagrans TaxID=97331 RepID=A0A436ZQ69_ARTFL|nr:hypothetical protein DFL_008935 [Arthrobotrys flagrans]